MKPTRLIARLLAPLSITLLLAGMYLGLSRPTLVETAAGSVQCASAFGTGSIEGATETGQASCAALTSERQVWSATLVAISLGLLFGLIWVTASAISTTDPREESADDGRVPRRGPGGEASWQPLDPSAGWADYPGQAPVTRAPAAGTTSGQSQTPPARPQAPQPEPPSRQPSPEPESGSGQGPRDG